MRRRISIRGCVRPSVRRSVRQSVRRSVGPSRVIFERILGASCAVYPALFSGDLKMTNGKPWSFQMCHQHEKLSFSPDMELFCFPVTQTKRIRVFYVCMTNMQQTDKPLYKHSDRAFHRNAQAQLKRKEKRV